MNSGRRGMVWLELLVAISACMFVSLAGVRAIGFFLDRMARQQSADIEVAEIRGLGQRLQRLFDQRRDNPYAAEPVLIIEGQALPEGLRLERMHLRSLDESGKAIEWDLRDTGKRWVEEISFPDGENREAGARNLRYTGEIHIVPDKGNGAGHPEIQFWKFPEASSQLAQEGFAIYRFW